MLMTSEPTELVLNQTTPKLRLTANLSFQTLFKGFKVLYLNV